MSLSNDIYDMWTLLGGRDSGCAGPCNLVNDGRGTIMIFNGAANTYTDGLGLPSLCVQRCCKTVCSVKARIPQFHFFRVAAGPYFLKLYDMNRVRSFGFNSLDIDCAGTKGTRPQSVNTLTLARKQLRHVEMFLDEVLSTARVARAPFPVREVRCRSESNLTPFPRLSRPRIKPLMDPYLYTMGYQHESDTSSFVIQSIAFSACVRNYTSSSLFACQSTVADERSVGLAYLQCSLRSSTSCISVIMAPY
ncbi:uncharacterized protein ARMOST_02438 [Armillaria ostoyae]|uniref:Uncharacterized protein n=1 Tax=Armillaria ostoyae TaxID=47428 RepID=A0A284QRY0_ARMOS|nr:uncharacterized protein ARMOST_02438 [Armillaria ostoyae]